MPCKVCQRSPEEAEFYSSIATYCKEHWRARVKQNRAENAGYYKAFDMARANLPHRVEARKAYQQTEPGKAAAARAKRKWSQENRKQRRAQNAVATALRKGLIYPMPCIVCGEDAEAHHPDYDQPLDVMWLCDAHHKETHVMARRLTK